MELKDILEHGEAALQAAIDEQQVEHLTLDFKETGEGTPASLFLKGSITPKGQELIAEAISAFANSAGGLVVIGVRCKPINKIDAASALVPIAEIKKAQSSLSGLLGQLVQPRHDGLQLHAIPSAAATGSGYLIVEIPRSDRRPHRSELDGRYYKRSGASTFTMEHYDVEDAFKRISSPRLELKTDLRWRMRTGGDPTKQIMVLGLALANVSDVSAQDVTLTIRDRSGAQFKVVGLDASAVITDFEGGTTISRQPGQSVHPGDTRRLVNIEFYAWGSPTEVQSLGDAADGRHSGSSVKFSLTISAQNMRPLQESIVSTLADVQATWHS
jgi:hypothetical protein